MCVKSSALSENEALINEISGTLSVNRIIVELLYSRGYKDILEIENFLHPGLSLLPSPYLLKDMHTAVNRLRKAVDSKEQIGIFTDSDLDGITSLACLSTFFEKLEIYPFYRYYKDDESYGITTEIIDEFIKQGVSLLITADSGVRDVEALNYAVSRSIDVIVTDHHEQDTELPDAIIVNPKQDDCEYPFSRLAGVGVVFKFIHAILMSYNRNFNSNIIIVPGKDNPNRYAVLCNDIIMKRSSFENLSEFHEQIREFDSGIIIAGREFAEEVSLPEAFSFISYDSLLKTEGVDDLRKPDHRLYGDELSYSIDLFREINFASSKKTRSLLEEILPFVAIGTIADIMPLTGENRVLVKNGLSLLDRNSHPGLASLIYGRPANSKMIGWELAPLLNTPGRFGRTSLSVDFFLNKNRESVDEVIAEMQAMNEERRGMVTSLFAEIKEAVDGDKESVYKNILLVDSAGVPDGVAGLIANRLVDYSGKPAVVLSDPDNESLVKGSGRSYSGLDFFSHVRQFSENFIRIGGHPQAFGFTMESSKIEETFTSLDRMLNGIAAPEKKMSPELEVSPEELGRFSVEMLELLEPFGNGNEQPVFCSPSVNITGFSAFGAEKKHGRFQLSDADFRAIGWNMAEKMEHLFSISNVLDLIYTLEVNFFRNEKSLQMIIQEIYIPNK